MNALKNVFGSIMNLSCKQILDDFFKDCLKSFLEDIQTLQKCLNTSCLWHELVSHTVFPV